jgi:hypothetical protein
MTLLSLIESKSDDFLDFLIDRTFDTVNGLFENPDLEFTADQELSFLDISTFFNFQNYEIEEKRSSVIERLNQLYIIIVANITDMHLQKRYCTFITVCKYFILNDYSLTQDIIADLNLLYSKSAIPS